MLLWNVIELVLLSFFVIGMVKYYRVSPKEFLYVALQWQRLLLFAKIWVLISWEWFFFGNRTHNLIERWNSLKRGIITGPMSKWLWKVTLKRAYRLYLMSISIFVLVVFPLYQILQGCALPCGKMVVPFDFFL